MDNTKKIVGKGTPVIYLLIVLGGLLIPLIIYLFTFSPVLTDNLSKEIAFANFLAESGSHISADGWISTKGFFPFSLNYFLTFFVSTNSWQKAVCYASVCCYIVYAICFILFCLSLHAKKIITYVICAVSSMVIGCYGIYALSDGIYFISYISAILVFAGLIINCIRIKVSTKVRFICCGITSLIIISALSVTFCVAKTNNRKILDLESVKNCFTYPLFDNAKLKDKEICVEGIADYLVNKNISAAYSTDDIANTINAVTNNKVVVAYIENAEFLMPSDIYDRSLDAYEVLSQGSEAIYVIVGASFSDSFNEYLPLATIEYCDDYYSLYSFGSEFPADTSTRDDMINIMHGGYDTYILSMSDVSSMNLSELYRTTLWTTYAARYVFTDLSALDTYSELIIRNSPQRIIIGIDPYALFVSANNDKDEYIRQLHEKLESHISGNPEVSFSFIFQNYHLSHFEDYSATDFDNMQLSYEYFVSVFEPYPNIIYNYYGYMDYLNSNPYVYEISSDSVFEPEIARQLMLETLTDGIHRMSPSELLAHISELIEKAKEYQAINEPEYNLTDTTVVIFGDSIFGNYSDKSAIQQIVADYSGATVICKAVGGATATTTGNTGLQLEDQLKVSELQGELSKIPAGNKLVFIFEFGINDYLSCCQIGDSSVASNTDTFVGALNITISTIRSNWPESEIILMAPGYIMSHDYGETPLTEDGYSLSDYRNEMIKLADETDCDCIDLTNIGITQENCNQYICNDLIHYNGDGRYYVGKYLLNYLVGHIDN